MNERRYTVLRFTTVVLANGCESDVPESVEAAAEDLEADEIAAMPKRGREQVLDVLLADLEVTPGSGGGYMLVQAATRGCECCAGEGRLEGLCVGGDGQHYEISETCDACDGAGKVRVKAIIAKASPMAEEEVPF